MFLMQLDIRKFSQYSQAAWSFGFRADCCAPFGGQSREIFMTQGTKGECLGRKTGVSWNSQDGERMRHRRELGTTRAWTTIVHTSLLCIGHPLLVYPRQWLTHLLPSCICRPRPSTTQLGASGPRGFTRTQFVCYRWLFTWEQTCFQAL